MQTKRFVSESLENTAGDCSLYHQCLLILVSFIVVYSHVQLDLM